MYPFQGSEKRNKYLKKSKSLQVKSTPQKEIKACWSF